MSEFIAPNSDKAIQEAAKNGMEVVFPAPNKIQLDFDSMADEPAYKYCRGVLDKYWGIVSEKRNQSKSGQAFHIHLTVTLKREVSAMERVALQAMLGSDRMREILSLIQVLEGDPHPTLFVEKKALT